LQSVDLLRLAGQVGDLERRVEAIRFQNELLREQIDFAKTDAYIEQVAREELGLVRPNEVLYAPSSQGSGP